MKKLFAVSVTVLMAVLALCGIAQAENPPQTPEAVSTLAAPAVTVNPENPVTAGLLQFVTAESYDVIRAVVWYKDDEGRFGEAGVWSKRWEEDSEAEYIYGSEEHGTVNIMPCYCQLYAGDWKAEITAQRDDVWSEPTLVFFTVAQSPKLAGATLAEPIGSIALKSPFTVKINAVENATSYWAGLMLQQPSEEDGSFTSDVVAEVEYEVTGATEDDITLNFTEWSKDATLGDYWMAIDATADGYETSEVYFWGLNVYENVTPAAPTLSFDRTSGQPGDTVYATVTAPGATQVKVTGVWREESYYDLEDDQVVIPVILDFYDDADEEGNLLGRTFSVCALVQGEWSEEVSQKLTTVLRPDLSGTIFRNAPTTLAAGEDLVIEFLPVDGITNYYITNDSFVEEVKEPGILTIPASLFYKGGTFSFDCGAGDDYAGDLIIDWVSVEAEAYTDAEPLTISANKAETEPGKTVTFTLGGKQATRIYVQRRAMEDEDYWYDYYRNSEPVDPAAGSFEVMIDGSGDYRISALVDGKWTDWSDPVTVEVTSAGPTAVLPSFTLPESLRAGEPLIMQFTERFPDDMWIHVSFYLDEDFVSEPSTMFSNGALEDDLTHVQVENGLDSGEYKIDIYAEQDGYENSDTVTCYLTVTGERPDAPSLEIVSNNAASDQRNEIRITAEELDGFILYAEYYNEDAGFDFNGAVQEHEMEWTEVSDSEILVKVDRPYGSYSGVYRAAVCVDGLYSRRSEDSVTLTWSEEESGGDGGAEETEAAIVDSENIECSKVSCEYTAGEDAYNPGSVGSMTINCTVNGPSELRNLWIGSWGTEQPDEATIEEDMEFYARIWKPDYSSPDSLTFPQQIGGGMPIHEDEIGQDLYVLLIGLDKDCNAIGYLVVRVSVPGTAVQGDVEFSGYTLNNLARWENNPLYLPAGGFSTYLPVFLYTEDWTNVSDASVTWVSGDENLKDMFRIVHQEGDNEMFYLNIASYNGTGTATYLLTATSETGTATKTFTVTVKEMPEDGIPRQLKDKVWIPVNETVNLSSLGIMYNPEGYEEVYYVSGDDFLVVEHEYEDVDGKRFTLKRDGTFMAREAGTYSARYDILPGGNLGAMFDYEIVAEECLKIPEGIERIESEAFRNIGASIIRIPESVQSIADDAFDSDVTLVLEKGSKWENWAAEKGYQVCVTE